ncbi:MAG: hypothetical protein IKJ32_04545 [Clostridia bacterium]|nr:hypothetical protein [Clostridia bacterium]
MFAGMEMSAVLAVSLCVGAIVTIVIAIINWSYVNAETFEVDDRNAKTIKLGKFEFKPKVIFKYAWIVILHLATMFSIATIGGIADAGWINGFSPNNMAVENMGGFLSWFLLIVALIIFIGLPVFLTYLVGLLVIGLPRYTKKISHIIFIATFLLSIGFWLNYMVNYEANVETTSEVLEQSEERELLMFYEIPVQQVSGSVSGGSFIGTGNVSGSVFTTDKVPYVYINSEGKGKWDSAPAAESEIIFITEEGGVPKIVITTYTEKTIEIDHNVNKKNVIEENSWCKYYFYIPKSAVQSFDTE